MLIAPLQTASLRQGSFALARTVAARLDRHPVGRSWTQLLMLTLVVWIALFCSGIGNAMGAPPDVVVNRIEARMLAHLRQGATSQASRWARAEPGTAVSTWSTASNTPLLPNTPCAAVLPCPSLGFEHVERQAEQPVHVGLPVRTALRWHTPLTRAPPFQAHHA